VKQFLLYSLLLLIVACNKTSPRSNDRESPTVSITQPINNTVATPNTPLNITGTVADNQYIAEIHIHITNLNTGQLILDVHLYPAAAQASFSQAFTPQAGQRYKIQVIARDRSVNEGSKTLEISA
jgi:hypothetical protein